MRFASKGARMKKILCVLLFTLCMLAVFSQEAEPAAATEEATSSDAASVSITPPSWGGLSLGLSNSYFKDDRYVSDIFEGCNTYINPYFDAGGQWGFGKHFSLNFYTPLNLTAISKGTRFYVDWFEGCHHWAGEATPALNFLLGFTPYLIGLIPACFEMLCALDVDVGIFYHPYYNNWLDTKIGAGLSNEPSNFYDMYGWSLYLQPFVFVRAEVDLSYGKFVTSVYCSYSNDIFKALDIWLGNDPSESVFLDKFTIGARVSLKTKE